MAFFTQYRDKITTLQGRYITLEEFENNLPSNPSIIYYVKLATQGGMTTCALNRRRNTIAVVTGASIVESKEAFELAGVGHDGLPHKFTSTERYYLGGTCQKSLSEFVKDMKNKVISKNDGINIIMTVEKLYALKFSDDEDYNAVYKTLTSFDLFVDESHTYSKIGYRPKVKAMRHIYYKDWANGEGTGHLIYSTATPHADLLDLPRPVRTEAINNLTMFSPQILPVPKVKLADKLYQLIPFIQSKALTGIPKIIFTNNKRLIRQLHLNYGAKILVGSKLSQELKTYEINGDPITVMELNGFEFVVCSSRYLAGWDYHNNCAIAIVSDLREEHTTFNYRDIRQGIGRCRATLIDCLVISISANPKHRKRYGNIFDTKELNMRNANAIANFERGKKETKEQDLLDDTLTNNNDVYMLNDLERLADGLLEYGIESELYPNLYDEIIGNESISTVQRVMNVTKLSQAQIFTGIDTFTNSMLDPYEVSLTTLEIFIMAQMFVKYQFVRNVFQIRKMSLTNIRKNILNFIMANDKGRMIKQRPMSIHENHVVPMLHQPLYSNICEHDNKGNINRADDNYQTCRMIHLFVMIQFDRDINKYMNLSKDRQSEKTNIPSFLPEDFVRKATLKEILSTPENYLSDETIKRKDNIIRSISNSITNNGFIMTSKDEEKINANYKKLTNHENCKKPDKKPITEVIKYIDRMSLLRNLKHANLYGGTDGLCGNISKTPTRCYSPFTGIAKVLRESLPVRYPMYDIVAANGQFVYLMFLKSKGYNVYDNRIKVLESQGENPERKVIKIDFNRCLNDGYLNCKEKERKHRKVLKESGIAQNMINILMKIIKKNQGLMFVAMTGIELVVIDNLTKSYFNNIRGWRVHDGYAFSPVDWIFKHKDLELATQYDGIKIQWEDFDCSQARYSKEFKHIGNGEMMKTIYNEIRYLGFVDYKKLDRAERIKKNKQAKALPNIITIANAHLFKTTA